MISHDIAEDKEELHAWIQARYEELFEQELADWDLDESLWPKNRNWEMFQKWFYYELHTCVEDTCEGSIIDEDEEEE